MTIKEFIDLIPEIQQLAKEQWGNELKASLNEAFGQVLIGGWKADLSKLIVSDNPSKYFINNHPSKISQPINAKSDPVKKVFILPGQGYPEGWQSFESIKEMSGLEIET